MNNVVLADVFVVDGQLLAKSDVSGSVYSDSTSSFLLAVLILYRECSLLKEKEKSLE